MLLSFWLVAPSSYRDIITRGSLIAEVYIIIALDPDLLSCSGAMCNNYNYL